jgi:hypothetical protein
VKDDGIPLPFPLAEVLWGEFCDYEARIMGHPSPGWIWCIVWGLGLRLIRLIGV